MVVLVRVDDTNIFSLFSDQRDDTRRLEDSLSRRLPLLEDLRSRWDGAETGAGLWCRHRAVGSGRGWW